MPEFRNNIMNTSTTYALISPCRNEADYMRETLDTVAAQTVKPTLWVIVDDGSSDATPAILAEYAAKYSWIRIVTRKDRGHRAVGPGVIDAFYAGYETIRADDFAFICKLDLDLRLPPRYFEILIQRAVLLGAGLKEIGRAAEDCAIRCATRLESGSLQKAAQRLGVTDRALQIRRANMRELTDGRGEEVQPLN